MLLLLTSLPLLGSLDPWQEQPKQRSSNIACCASCMPCSETSSAAALNAAISKSRGIFDFQTRPRGHQARNILLAGIFCSLLPFLHRGRTREMLLSRIARSAACSVAQYFENDLVRSAKRLNKVIAPLERNIKPDEFISFNGGGPPCFTCMQLAWAIMATFHIRTSWSLRDSKLQAGLLLATPHMGFEHIEARLNWRRAPFWKYFWAQHFVTRQHVFNAAASDSTACAPCDRCAAAFYSLCLCEVHHTGYIVLCVFFWWFTTQGVCQT